MYTSMFRKAMLGDTALLALDFSSGTMPTAVTFTRADTTARATFIDASGYVKTVATAGDPRFDYTGGVAKGLLIEAVATNYFLYTSSLSNVTWQVGVGGPNDVTMTYPAVGITDPSNGSSAGFLSKPNTSTGLGFIRQTSMATGAVSGNRTVSCWFKQPTSNAARYVGIRCTGNGFTPANAGFYATFDLQNGVVVTNAGTNQYTNVSIDAYANGWYKCSATSGSMGTAATTTAGFSIVEAGNGNESNAIQGGTYIWGPQLELGNRASSYIATGASSLTRLADDAVIRSTAWTSLYAQPGAMVVEFYRGAYGAGDRSILSTDPTATRHWHLKQANASATAQIAYSTGSATTQTGLTAGLNKVAIQWNAPTPTASFDLCVNGATPTFGGSNVGTTLSTWLTLGSQSTTGVSGSGTWDGYLNNSIKSVKYYAGLTYAEMQAKTT